MTEMWIVGERCMEYDSFIKNIDALIGIDLANYKRTQMERRIRGLMRFEGYGDYEAYLQALRDDHAKLEKLIERLTIKFSEFFRDPAQWGLLEKKVLPELYGNNRRLKIWSAGCAGGEEAYTLAMILADLGIIETSLIATDIDASALEKARLGVYMDKSVNNVSAVRLQKHFNMVDSSYQVKDRLKKTVSFKRHDLTEEPPPGSNCDLIICRNVIIYFTEETKNVLYQMVIRALRVGGYLFAGNTEQIFHPERIGLTPAGGQFFYKKTV
jgi:chemotaxis protein methyltransferase CheR